MINEYDNYKIFFTVGSKTPQVTGCKIPPSRRRNYYPLLRSDSIYYSFDKTTICYKICCRKYNKFWSLQLFPPHMYGFTNLTAVTSLHQRCSNSPRQQHPIVVVSKKLFAFFCSTQTFTSRPGGFHPISHVGIQG